MGSHCVSWTFSLHSWLSVEFDASESLLALVWPAMFEIMFDSLWVLPPPMLEHYLHSWQMSRVFWICDLLCVACWYHLSKCALSEMVNTWWEIIIFKNLAIAVLHIHISVWWTKRTLISTAFWGEKWAAISKTYYEEDQWYSMGPLFNSKCNSTMT